MECCITEIFAVLPRLLGSPNTCYIILVSITGFGVLLIGQVCPSAIDGRQYFGGGMQPVVISSSVSLLRMGSGVTRLAQTDTAKRSNL